MKKLLSLILILAILTSFAIFASAETDLSTMSIAELNDLLEQVIKAILDKGESAPIASGTYYCGQDLAPGTYELMKAPGYEDRTSVYKISSESYKLRDSNYLSEEHYIRITVKESEILTLGAPCFIRKAPKIGF